jgi:hypothetical protein
VKPTIYLERGEVSIGDERNGTSTLGWLKSRTAICDRILSRMPKQFSRMYSPSDARRLRLRSCCALLLRMLYTIRSERMLMEQLEYNMLFRWLIGLNMDEAVWDVTVFSKNRERLVRADIAKLFFEEVVAEAQSADLMSDEHFTVDGTLLEAPA